MQQETEPGLDLAEVAAAEEEERRRQAAEDMGIVWEEIDDPAFQGEMSRYPITNEQFARFLIQHSLPVRRKNKK